MSSKLVWKIVSAAGSTIGTTRYPEDAAALVALQGNGAKVEVDGRIVYRQGKPTDVRGGDGDASESYDYAAETMRQRRQRHNEERVGNYRQAQAEAQARALRDGRVPGQLAGVSL